MAVLLSGLFYELSHIISRMVAVIDRKIFTDKNLSVGCLGGEN